MNIILLRIYIAGVFYYLEVSMELETIWIYSSFFESFGLGTRCSYPTRPGAGKCLSEALVEILSNSTMIHSSAIDVLLKNESVDNMDYYCRLMRRTDSYSSDL